MEEEEEEGSYVRGLKRGKIDFTGRMVIGERKARLVQETGSCKSLLLLLLLVLLSFIRLDSSRAEHRPCNAAAD